MAKMQGRVTRQGRVYRFKIDEQDYAAFVWQMGKQFCGRIEGNTNAPQVKGATALTVRDALRAWLVETKAQ